MDELSGPALDRRKFLAALAGAGGGFLANRRHVASALQVTARASVFYALPDAKSTLVRFTVDGSSAPAGRLRVFDRARRLLGTAGVIGFGGRLYGELWLTLDRDTDLSTELELPGVRGVLRTVHRVTPARRWTIYWTTVANNPIATVTEPEFLDHPAFLSLVAASAPFAIDESGLLERIATAPLLLAGAALRLVGVRNPVVPLSKIESRDGSAVFAVALAPGGSPRELGLAAGRGEMERRVEQWLEGPGNQLADASSAVALIAGTSAEDTDIIEQRTADWNSRYAYPRIVTGSIGELLGILDRRAFPPVPRRERPVVDRWRAAERNGSATVTRVFEPLVSRLGAGGAGLAALAGQFAFSVPGTLVVNATPFTSTGVAVMPDGSERVVTDVPGHGYVCIPDAETVGRWEPVAGGDNDLTLDNRNLQVRVDAESGAMRSVVTLSNGREWVRRGGGFNHADGFRLDSLQKTQHPAIGTRLIATRRRDAVVLRSTMTIYHGMPWIDLLNEWSGAPEPAHCSFGVALDRPTASWEVPGGFDESGGAVGQLVHLRWLKVSSGTDTLYFRGLDAPVASVSAEAEIISTSPMRSRYRLGFASGFSAPDDPWRFGWSAEPFATAAVPGTGRATLPSFGSLFVIDQGGACLLDVRHEAGSGDTIVVLQELAGTQRDITLGPGVLSFSRARRIDLTGRDLGELSLGAGRGAVVPVRGFGIAVVRLSGVELARA